LLHNIDIAVVSECLLNIGKRRLAAYLLHNMDIAVVSECLEI